MMPKTGRFFLRSRDFVTSGPLSREQSYERSLALTSATASRLQRAATRWQLFFPSAGKSQGSMVFGVTGK
jgi:hypothetical protein